VPTAGLEAVLVAVERVIESGVTGCVNPRKSGGKRPQVFRAKKMV